jgi:hypothetical protein
MQHRWKLTGSGEPGIVQRWRCACGVELESKGDLPSSTDHARTLYLPDGVVQRLPADWTLASDCTRAVKPDTLRARLLPSYHKPRLSRMRFA